MEQSRTRPVKKGKGPKAKAKSKINPNPDEVIEIERPGSAASHQSKASLFSAGTKTDDTEAIQLKSLKGAKTEETNLNDSVSFTEPMKQGSGLLPRASSATSRSASPSILPFKTSKVTPAEEHVNGSQTSVRSSLKEAWVGAEVKPDQPEKSALTILNVENTNQKTRDEDTKSIKSASSAALLSPPKMKGEEHAYVPYLFARDTVVKIVNDMEKMKSGHIHAIHQIEFNYKMIEDETQRQFNGFVLNLRNVYKDKVAIFKHVITIHRKDTDNKQLYWDTHLKSMAERNKKLLKDKKALLIQHKVMTDRLTTIREDAQRELIVELDALNLKIAQLSKEHKESLEEERVEAKAVRDSLQKEQEEVESLKAQLTLMGEMPVTSEISRPTEVIAEDERQLHAAVPAAQIVTKEVVVDMSEKQRKEIALERQKMIDELAKQRNDLENERSTFIVDRKQLNDEKNELQKSINESEKEIASWRAKYEANKTKLQQFSSLRNDYDALLAAYNVVVAAAATVDTTKADEKIAQSTESKAALEEDKKGLEEDIKNWEVDFEKKNGRAPTEEDQPENIQEFKIMLKETDAAIQNLQVEVDTMEKLKKGEVPEAPKSSPAADSAISIAEPVIQVVEVIVPDPEIVKKLELTETKVDGLQKENSMNQKKINDFQNDVATLNNQIKEIEAKLTKAVADHAYCNKTILKLTNKFKEETQKVKAASQFSATVAVAANTSGEASSADIQPEQNVSVVAVAGTDDESAQKILELEKRVEELEEELEIAQMSGETPEVTIESDTEKIAELEAQIDSLEEKLRKEENEHQETKEELESLKLVVKSLQDDLETAKSKKDEDIKASSVALTAQLAKKEKELSDAQARVADLEAKMLQNLPVDTAGEMKKLLKKIQSLTKDNDVQSKKAAELEEKNGKLTSDMNNIDKLLTKEKQTNEQTQLKLKAAKEEKQKEIDKLTAQWDKKEKTRVAENKAKIETLQRKIKELESRPAVASIARPEKAAKGGATDAKSEKQLKALTEQLQEKKKENKELLAKMTQLQDDIKRAKSDAGGDVKEQKKQEKIMKELAKKLDLETKKAERDGAKAKELEVALATLQKEKDSQESEVKKLKAEMDQLGVAAAQSIELAEKVKTMETEVKSLNKETQKLTEAYNTERVQRKKYFNMVEDMKGKIRVYCRARPMSSNELERGNFSVIQSPDEYSLNVQSSRGLKEFNFDRVFMPENSQEQVFEDTYHLVQSAADGYNVCIFAYGQTGSGKTFTMIGDGKQQFPGVAPRAFKRIFEVIEENKEKFNYKVSSYMLELYNDKLLDLYAGAAGTPDEKMDIKKDKQGLVFVKGALVREAATEEDLYALFEEGSRNRHTASTKMNAESSRSHLVLSVIIEGTNKTNGQVNRGKLSLVDLAGSERVGKTGATAETLKEANSINKSLAALGNVISALSSEQSFIPYRDNKLTQLMQDSLGGNAKTLMFVNISPADYNGDETVTSLTYASRVKLITNDAQKNSDNKEIAKLKAIIAKMQAGDEVAEDET